MTVCLSVCLSVSVSTITSSGLLKSNQLISLKLDVVIGPSNGKNRLTFGGDPVADTDSRSLFCFSHRCGIEHSGTFYSHAVTGEMTDSDNGMNPLHFGNKPADAWINLEIRI